MTAAAQEELLLFTAGGSDGLVWYVRDAAGAYVPCRRMQALPIRSRVTWRPGLFAGTREHAGLRAFVLATSRAARLPADVLRHAGGFLAVELDCLRIERAPLGCLDGKYVPTRDGYQQLDGRHRLRLRRPLLGRRAWVLTADPAGAASCCPRRCSGPPPVAYCRVPLTARQRGVRRLLVTVASNIACKALCQPLHRARLVLQQQHHLHRAGVLPRPLAGVGDCLLALLRCEGPLAWWRGTLAAAARSLLAAGLALVPRPPACPPRLYRALRGALTFAALYPLDLAHARLSCDVGARAYGGALGTLRAARPGGARACCAGLALSFVGLYCYRRLVGWLYRRTQRPRSARHRLLVGWSLGLFASVVTYPLDTVRRRLALEPAQLRSCVLLEAYDCAQRIFFEGGPSRFYAAFGYNALRMLGSAVIDRFLTACGLKLLDKLES